MQVQFKNADPAKKVQTFGTVAFIGAAVLFGLGFLLMLAADGALMSYQVPLILMTIAATDMCFAAALSSMDVPASEKTRLRTLSIVGAVVVVFAATLIPSDFRVGVFEIVIMVAALGGAPGMYKVGEVVGAKMKAPAKAGSASSAAAEKSGQAQSGETPKSGESSSPTA